MLTTAVTVIVDMLVLRRNASGGRAMRTRTAVILAMITLLPTL